MGLACRTLLRAIAGAEGFWERLCVRHGWSRPPPGPRALPGGGAAAALSLTPQELDPRWFRYYCDRMACRRNVRRFMKLYVPFLSRPSSMALLPGASPAQLEAAERRLGAPLPPELWELYRFRAGQAGGAFVSFADDMRLLALDEVALERPVGLTDLRARLAALGRPAPAQLERPGAEYGAVGGGGCDVGVGGGEGGCVRAENSSGAPQPGRDPAPAAVAPPSGSSEGGDDIGRGGGGARSPGTDSNTGAGGGAGVGTGARSGDTGAGGGPDDGGAFVVAANGSNSRRLLVALDGQVYLVRGVSVNVFAPCVSAMLQKCLT